MNPTMASNFLCIPDLFQYYGTFKVNLYFLKLHELTEISWYIKYK